MGRERRRRSPLVRRTAIAISAAALIAGMSFLGVSAASGVQSHNCKPVSVLPSPPHGFDPATATPAQLVKYGLPPPPPGAGPRSAAYRGWLTAMKAARVRLPLRRVCGTVTHASGGGAVARGAPRPSGRAVPSCSPSDYRVSVGGQGATGALVGMAGVVSRRSAPCRLRTRLTLAAQERIRGMWKTIRPMVGNPSQAGLAGVLTPDASLGRDWAWWNYCGPRGTFRFLASAGDQRASTLVTPPFCNSMRKGPGGIEPFPPRARSAGRLSGTLDVCCNAHGSMPEPGVVVIRGRSGAAQHIKVPRSGRFSVSEPPGRYLVVGGLPSLGWRLGRCVLPGPAPSAAFVYAGQTTQVEVTCQGQ